LKEIYNTVQVTGMLLLNALARR